MSTNKRGRPKTGLQTCECGYSTERTSNFKQHRMTCKMVSEANLLAVKDELIESLKDQLAAKDRQMKEQLAAKDRQIQELIEVAKKPRVTTNVNVEKLDHLNVFGQDCIEHIDPQDIQKLFKCPERAVPEFIKLKRRNPANRNVRCQNKKQKIYQVLIKNHDGEKEWENRGQKEVCENLYENASNILEEEAAVLEEEFAGLEETRHGSKFLDFQDKVKKSYEGEDNKRQYNDQLDRIHHVIIS